MKSGIWSKRILKSFLIALLICGLGTFTSVQALQYACEPDCTMHQPVKPTPPPCCQGEEGIQHQVSEPQPKEPKSAQNACCGGTLCYDSPDGFSTFAWFSISEFQAALRSFPLGQQLNSPASDHRQPAIPPPIDDAIPRYKITCVYLI